MCNINVWRELWARLVDKAAPHYTCALNRIKMEVEEATQGDCPETQPLEVESDEKEAVNLKRMAEDYAKYLIVNSKQDVSPARSG